jgi:NADH dehydrogenase
MRIPRPSRRPPAPTVPAEAHQLVVVGGGFAGLYAVRSLRDAPVQITLIDRHNHHLFAPLLYQVATGALAPAEIAQPLRSLLRGQRNVQVLLGEAVDLDPDGRRVILEDGSWVAYDSLLIATGVRHAYFGHDEWAAHAPGLKTVADALEIRRRVLLAFEAAERELDHAVQREWLTFVIVGGGPTGVELAGALGEIANDALRHEFRAIRPETARILLVEATERILPTYPPDLSRAAAHDLEELGSTVWTGRRVVDVDGAGVTVEGPDGPERIAARTVLWAAGVQTEPFGRAVAQALGVDTDRAGRIAVAPDLSVPGHPGIFVVGDLALVTGSDGRPVPGVAQGAIQGGRHVARVIRARLAGEAPQPFRFKDLGELATIGRLRGVADLRRIRFHGFVAWALWLSIHLFWLVGLHNRIIVFIRWTWSFITRGRGNRLITGEGPPVTPASPTASTQAPAARPSMSDDLDRSPATEERRGSSGRMGR